MIKVILTMLNFSKNFIKAKERF